MNIMRNLRHAWAKPASSNTISDIRGRCSSHPRVGGVRHVGVGSAAAVEAPPALHVPPTASAAFSHSLRVSGNSFTNILSNLGFKGSALDPPTYVKATGKIVAIGDLHGDMDKTLASLIAASVVELDWNGRPEWVGEDTVVVQLGDVMDRGSDEIRIIMLLRDLDRQARMAGGAVYMLNGNHESLNVCGDFRYVAGAAFLESAEYAEEMLWPMPQNNHSDHWARLTELRTKMFQPGGPMARELAKNPTVLVVNDTAFAHGGLLQSHVAYGIERLNSEVAAWMRGDPAPNGGRSPPPFLAMGDAKSVMWTRVQSREVLPTLERPLACRALQLALKNVRAKRLVVGHTPQIKGCNCECDGQVWRVDVGMSSGVLNSPVEILEIRQTPRGATVMEVIGGDGTVLQRTVEHLAPPPLAAEAFHFHM